MIAPARPTAAAAFARADEAHSKIDGHEALCAERYENIHETLGTMKKILGWAGGSMFTLLFATLGWLIAQQVSQNNADKATLRAQIEVLERAAATTPTDPTRVPYRPSTTP